MHDSEILDLFFRLKDVLVLAFGCLYYSAGTQ